ncbi:hypothetical protein WDU94_009201 [Cyamophila willieti]
MTTLSVHSENRALNFIIKSEDLNDATQIDHDRLAEKHKSQLLISSARIATDKEEFECWICKAVFVSANEFTFHLRSHNSDSVSPDNKRFSCKICHKMLGSANSLDRHILIHTGERPFKCKYCSLTFTTNGNMHRHIRANHQARHLNSSTEECWSHDSNGSADSYDDHSSPGNSEKKRKFSDSEYNNNNSSTIVDNNNVHEKCKEVITNRLSHFCPVCNVEETSMQDLEAHMTEMHPKYQARCDKCNLLFQNHQFLNLHIYMAHTRDELYNGLNGRKRMIPDLAGLIKETQILSGKHVENGLSKVTHELKCEKCFLEFSNGSDLLAHYKNCVPSDGDTSSNENYSATDLSSVKSKRNCSESSVEEEKKREEFFNGLDLKNVSQNANKCLSNGTENKDLADIQSIITNTSTTHLIADLSKSPEPNTVDMSPMDSSCGDEEQQDCFAAEFRKMKLRGEFPCRLCSSIFPNLRALKGHNRVHLNSCPGSINDPYRCNMCPHSSTDKSVLLRHMRTHNGDRPYECSICRYAFTTKANCERHLRNRHSKMTREDVKKSIIYHPSEDPTNDFSDQSSYYSKEEFKKSLFSDSIKDGIGLLKSRVRVSSLLSDKTKMRSADTTESLKSANSIMNCSMNSSDWMDESPERKNLDMSAMTSDEEEEDEHHEDVEEDKVIVKTETKGTEETPLDLSVDALDLSKKRQLLANSIKTEEDKPQDLSVKPSEPIPNVESSHSPSYFVPTKLEVKEEPKESTPPEQTPVDMSGMYVKNQINQLYDLVENRSFPPNIPPAFHPYFFPTPMLPLGFQPNINGAKDFQKDIFRGVPINSRGVIDQIAMASAAERIQAIQQQALIEYNKRMESTKNQFDKKPSDNPTIPVPNNGINNNSEKVVVKAPSSTSSSVKMVLKDGVLQAKPKQRRYRTERPFFCEHCSGRFTLRSNMERHIKQQHPQFWIQKQRGGSSGSRRGHPYKLLGFSERGDNKIMPLGFNPNGSHGYEDINQFGKALPNFGGHNEGLKSISDEVRIAISLQLKNKIISNEENGTKYYDSMKSLDTSPEHFRQSDHKENMSRMDREYERNDDTGNEDYDEDEDDDEEEEEELIIDETSVDNHDNSMNEDIEEERMDETDDKDQSKQSTKQKDDSGALDLASVSRLLDNASTQTFRQFFRDEEEQNHDGSEDDEEGLVAPSECNGSGSDENRSESEQNVNSSTEQAPKKKSAYSLAPNRVVCPYCDRKFPWSSSLRRHILTHTGQKPYKCSHCPLLFTTKSNCDRHLLRKHGGQVPPPVEVDKAALDSQALALRNVPDRPYKCIFCPSSTFATLSNLQKHLSCKHTEEKKSDDCHSGYEESQGSGSEDIEVMDKKSPPNMEHHNISGDLPFKCYLCEGSYAERQEALEHIRLSHTSEFQLLMSKGALDMNLTQEEPPHHDDANTSEENLEQLKGKFPDYANRKVMCAFCLRRFWSAEDLRRHMRTHTGERPFSCDICRRKFTLKHSMLRHRKKHNKLSNSEENFNSDDEAPMPQHFLNNNNSIINIPVNFWAARDQESSDLISNLLGIHDKTIIDKMLLSKSAEDAARLLGVQK